MGMYGAPDPGEAANAGIKRFTLTVRIENERGQDVLVVTNPRSAGCDKFETDDKFKTDQSLKGCIVAGPNETVDTKVQFRGSNGWYFTEFQICRVADDTPQKPANFDENDCKLTDDERADWLVMANSGVAIPGTDGLVDINQFGNGAIRQFNLRDQNWIEANYFYRIRACSSSTTCLWTDPGAQNTGRR